MPKKEEPRMDANRRAWGRRQAAQSAEIVGPGLGASGDHHPAPSPIYADTPVCFLSVGGILWFSTQVGHANPGATKRAELGS